MEKQPAFILPQPPKPGDTMARHFCALFMHQFQSAREPDPALRIHGAIHATAKISGKPPAAVADALVESGLRAAKRSFPGSFIAALEKSTATPRWNIAGATDKQRDLLAHWNAPRTH